MDNYEKYAVLKAKIKTLTEEMKIVNTQILGEMKMNDKTKLDTAVGKFTIKPYKTWTYTKGYTTMKEDLAARKAQEESTGDATFVEKPSLLFTPINL